MVGPEGRMAKGQLSPGRAGLGCEKELSAVRALPPDGLSAAPYGARYGKSDNPALPGLG